MYSTFYIINICLILRSVQRATADCSFEIPNGYITNERGYCDREIGSECSFSCNNGYRIRPAVTLTCKENRWVADSVDISNVCEATTTCTSYLQNGQFSKNCSFNLNSLCSFTCNAGYQPLYSMEALRCISTGKWEFDRSAVCRRECPVPVIPFGYTTAIICNRLSGQTCAYRCRPGYERDQTTPILLCREGQWDVARMDGLCRTAPTCPALTDSDYPGHLDPDCLRVINATCTFYCDDGLQGGPYLLKCLPGEIWNKFVSTFCYGRCSSYISHGLLASACRKLPSKACSYRCYEGYYMNPSVTSLYCTSDGLWNVNTGSLCIPKRHISTVECPGNFHRGYFDHYCLRLPGTRCAVNCIQGYSDIGGNGTHVTCQAGGYWKPDPDNLCHENPAGIENDNIAIGLGIGGFLLLVCALAGIFKVLRRRGYLRWPSSPTGNSDSRMTHANTSSQPHEPFFVSQFPMPPSYDNDDPPPYQEHDMFNTIHLGSPPSYSDAIKYTENIECGDNSRSESSQTITPRRKSITETTV